MLESESFYSTENYNHLPVSLLDDREVLNPFDTPPREDSPPASRPATRKQSMASSFLLAPYVDPSSSSSQVTESIVEKSFHHLQNRRSSHVPPPDTHQQPSSSHVRAPMYLPRTPQNTRSEDVPIPILNLNAHLLSIEYELSRQLTSLDNPFTRLDWEQYDTESYLRVAKSIDITLNHIHDQVRLLKQASQLPEDHLDSTSTAASTLSSSPMKATQQSHPPAQHSRRMSHARGEVVEMHEVKGYPVRRRSSVGLSGSMNSFHSIHGRSSFSLPNASHVDHAPPPPTSSVSKLFNAAFDALQGQDDDAAGASADDCAVVADDPLVTGATTIETEDASLPFVAENIPSNENVVQDREDDQVYQCIPAEGIDGSSASEPTLSSTSFPFERNLDEIKIEKPTEQSSLSSPNREQSMTSLMLESVEEELEAVSIEDSAHNVAVKESIQDEVSSSSTATILPPATSLTSKPSAMMLLLSTASAEAKASMSRMSSEVTPVEHRTSDEPPSTTERLEKSSTLARAVVETVTNDVKEESTLSLESVQQIFPAENSNSPTISNYSTQDTVIESGSLPLEPTEAVDSRKELSPHSDSNSSVEKPLPAAKVTPLPTNGKVSFLDQIKARRLAEEEAEAAVASNTAATVSRDVEETTGVVHPAPSSTMKADSVVASSNGTTSSIKPPTAAASTSLPATGKVSFLDQIKARRLAEEQAEAAAAAATSSVQQPVDPVTTPTVSTKEADKVTASDSDTSTNLSTNIKPTPAATSTPLPATGKVSFLDQIKARRLAEEQAREAAALSVPTGTNDSPSALTGSGTVNVAAPVSFLGNNQSVPASSGETSFAIVVDPAASLAVNVSKPDAIQIPAVHKPITAVGSIFEGIPVEDDNDLRSTTTPFSSSSSPSRAQTPSSLTDYVQSGHSSRRPFSSLAAKYTSHKHLSPHGNNSTSNENNASSHSLTTAHTPLTSSDHPAQNHMPAYSSTASSIATVTKNHRPLLFRELVLDDRNEAEEPEDVGNEDDFHGSSTVGATRSPHHHNGKRELPVNTSAVSLPTSSSLNRSTNQLHTRPHQSQHHLSSPMHSLTSAPAAVPLTSVGHFLDSIRQLDAAFDSQSPRASSSQSPHAVQVEDVDVDEERSEGEEQVWQELYATAAKIDRPVENRSSSSSRHRDHVVRDARSHPEGSSSSEYASDYAQQKNKRPEPRSQHSRHSQDQYQRSPNDMRRPPSSPSYEEQHRYDDEDGIEEKAYDRGRHNNRYPLKKQYQEEADVEDYEDHYYEEVEEEDGPEDAYPSYHHTRQEQRPKTSPKTTSPLSRSARVMSSTKTSSGGRSLRDAEDGEDEVPVAALRSQQQLNLALSSYLELVHRCSHTSAKAHRLLQTLDRNMETVQEHRRLHKEAHVVAKKLASPPRQSMSKSLSTSSHQQSPVRYPNNNKSSISSGNNAYQRMSNSSNGGSVTSNQSFNRPASSPHNHNFSYQEGPLSNRQLASSLASVSTSSVSSSHRARAKSPYSTMSNSNSSVSGLSMSQVSANQAHQSHRSMLLRGRQQPQQSQVSAFVPKEVLSTRPNPRVYSISPSKSRR